MRKSEQTHEERGQRRQWVAAGRSGRPPGKPAEQAEQAAKQAAAPRERSATGFVEPFPYSDSQRAAIIDALTQQGLGDASAREIFVGAIAYDLALLQHDGAQPMAAATSAVPPEEPERAPVQPQTSPEHAALIETGQRFLQMLRALDEDDRTRLLDRLRQSDPFDRAHDDAYVVALGREIERTVDALQALQPQAPPAPTERPPPPAPRARRPEHPAGIAFIRHAASVYEQCFETRPPLKAGGPFAQVLAVIAKATGIAIPTTARALKEALGQR
jgi:hypothetical protein